LRRAYLRAIDLHFEAVSVGRLRDRIVELAEKAGVKIGQIYLLPTGKGQMANAFAASGNNLLLTDCLIKGLTEREMDAVIAHELTHLKHRHPRQLGSLMVFLIVLPGGMYLTWLMAGMAFQDWMILP